MAWFLSVFLLTYSGMHAFVYVGARNLVAGHRLIQLLGLGFMGLMILAPAAVRVLESNGYELLARWTAFTGYWWMGFIFLAFCGFALVSVGDFLLRLGSVLGGVSLPQLAGKAASVTVLAGAVGLCCYGYWEARAIRVERLRLETTKLPPGVDLVKIAQISDVHLGLVVRSERLKLILDRVRAEDPDMLVSTGDLVDGQLDHLDELSDPFQQIRPRYGKFAVTGNHEYYAGLAEALSFTERCGFVTLRGETQTAGIPINVAGVDYPMRSPAGQAAALLASVANGRFTLFLQHLPMVAEQTEGLFDLQLSGHTHRGQIFPFRLVTGLFYPKQNGFYPLAQGSKLYTSRGSGTWGPPMRVLSPPEVTIIELTRPTATN
jgi:uncharacterized protein